MLDHGTGAENEEDGSQSFDGALLVAVRGNLFVIDEDFQVGEHADGYAAIGSGGSVALGALHATDGYLPHDKRVIAALKASERFCAGVRGPFITQTLPFDAGKDKKKRRQQ
jgi:ATP-dependent protease HslVU (ClpYQ) peptidase subunit